MKCCCCWRWCQLAFQGTLQRIIWEQELESIQRAWCKSSFARQTNRQPAVKLSSRKSTAQPISVGWRPTPSVQITQLTVVLLCKERKVPATANQAVYLQPFGSLMSQRYRKLPVRNRDGSYTQTSLRHHVWRPVPSSPTCRCVFDALLWQDCTGVYTRSPQCVWIFLRAALICQYLRDYR